jgi:hypothetical protein
MVKKAGFMSAVFNFWSGLGIFQVALHSMSLGVRITGVGARTKPMTNFESEV